MDAPISSSSSLSPPRLPEQVRGKIRPQHHTARTGPAYVDWVTDLSCAIVTIERAVVERFLRERGKRGQAQISSDNWSCGSASWLNRAWPL